MARLSHRAHRRRPLLIHVGESLCQPATAATNTCCTCADLFTAPLLQDLMWSMRARPWLTPSSPPPPHPRAPLLEREYSATTGAWLCSPSSSSQGAWSRCAPRPVPLSRAHPMPTYAHTCRSPAHLPTRRKHGARGTPPTPHTIGGAASTASRDLEADAVGARTMHGWRGWAEQPVPLPHWW